MPPITSSTTRPAPGPALRSVDRPVDRSVERGALGALAFMTACLRAGFPNAKESSIPAGIGPAPCPLNLATICRNAIGPPWNGGSLDQDAHRRRTGDRAGTPAGRGQR